MPNETYAYMLAFFLSALSVFAADNTKKSAVDPDGAYKNNCMPCHYAVRDY
jgi:hypothetical protein